MNMNDYKNVADRIEISTHCRDEVISMSKKRKNIKHKLSRKSICVITAAAIAACGGTAVFAAEKLGVFDKLSNKSDRTVVMESGKEIPLDKYDQNNYGNIALHAEDVSDKSEVTCEGLTLSVESVYCDGTDIVFGIKGTLAEESPIECNYIKPECAITINGKTYNGKTNDYSSGNPLIQRYEASLVADEDSDRTFSGSIALTVMPEDEILEATTAKIEISEIYMGNSYAELDTFLECDIELNAEITPDKSLIKECGLTMAEDGFEAKIYDISPVAINVGTKYPEFYDTNTEEITWEEDGNTMTGSKYSIVTLYYDENGNEMQYLAQYNFPDYGDGFGGGALAWSDTSEITVKWLNKQVQDENGNMELIYEHTFDISEYQN